MEPCSQSAVLGAEPERIQVLVLDDNPADIVAIERTIEQIKDTIFEIHPFNTVSAAIEFLEAQQDSVDLCLVDYRLQSETAFDFLTAVDQMPIKPLPTVVMTGQTEHSVDKQLLAAGVHDYWSKDSLNSETLSRCIRYALARHRNYLFMSDECDRKNRHIDHANRELKNPLNWILGYTKVLENIWKAIPEGSLNETQQKRAEDCFKVLFNSGNHLKALIAEVLDSAKIDLDPSKLILSTVDLETVLIEVFERYLPVAEAKGLELCINVPSSKVRTQGDAHKLYQIMVNLLSNAIKYTEHGDIKCSLSVVDQSSGARARITVEDTGRGIDSAVKAQIFEAPQTDSYVVDTATTITSAGLGLFITRKLVELHQGEISFSSELGKGTTFVVDLPLYDEEQSLEA